MTLVRALALLSTENPLKVSNKIFVWWRLTDWLKFSFSIRVALSLREIWQNTKRLRNTFCFLSQIYQRSCTFQISNWVFIHEENIVWLINSIFLLTLSHRTWQLLLFHFTNLFCAEFDKFYYFMWNKSVVTFFLKTQLL